jgi:cytidylate kinase
MNKSMNEKPLIITIDGPAGSGKSTVSKMLARKIGAEFLDTGAMYRAVTLVAMNKHADLSDENALMAVLNETDFDFQIENHLLKVTIDGKDATEAIRRPDVTASVRYIAAVSGIRSELVKLQQKMAEKLVRVVTEGRDQGTVAFPNADYKFFLVADVAERAHRRHAELIEKGLDAQIDKIQADITKRDDSDINRTDGPLAQAEDAIEIDSSNLDAEGVVQAMLKHIKL